MYRPCWAIGTFPVDLRTLLESCNLEHRLTCFRERENVAYLALELAACGSSMMLQRLGKLGLKMGERQSLIGSLSRSTRSLRMSAASLISPSIKARVSGQVGSNLLAFVATCPRSEAAAVDAAATGSSSLSIAGVVEAISMCGVDEVAMARLHEALVAQSLAWLGDGQIRQLQLLAVFVLLCVLDSGLRSEGALSHFASYRLFCEGMGLLPLSSRSERWHSQHPQHARIGPGAAILILSPPRWHLWKQVPQSVHVLSAVMGKQLDEQAIASCNDSARRTLTRGEIGILHSNDSAWRHAIDAGWEWALVLEDDAHLSEAATHGSPALLAFLARLPALVDAAAEHQSDWQLIVLSPVNTPYNFFQGTPAHCIPHVLNSPDLVREPHYLERPPSSYRGGDASASGGCANGRGLARSWQRCPPTYHAFGWIYRRPLMEKCVQAFAKREPPLEPLDIWVWEVAAANGMLSQAICLDKPLIQGSAGSAGHIKSVKDEQDDPRFLTRVYNERGYGKVRDP